MRCSSRIHTERRTILKQIIIFQAYSINLNASVSYNQVCKYSYLKCLLIIISLSAKLLE